MPRFQIRTSVDGLPIAYARIVPSTQGGQPYAYMEIPCCPLCGERHVHAAEALYASGGGTPVDYAPSFSRREAQCSPPARRNWIRLHPETAKYEPVYLLSPMPERTLERGSAVVGLLLMFIPLLLVIDLTSAIAMGGYAQVNVAAAARNCARMAAATLSQTLGPTQGEAVGMDTLKQAGLSRRDPHVSVGAGDWQRGGTVSCTAQVTVPFGAMGLIGHLIGVHDVKISESRQTQIEYYNSDWNN